MPDPARPAWALRKGEIAGPLEVHEGLFETADGRRMTLVAASEEALVATAAQMDAYAGQFHPLEQGEEPGKDRIHAVVEHSVHHIEKLVGGHHAYDVMTMLRQ
jgi:hypothetical protein